MVAISAGCYLLPVSASKWLKEIQFAVERYTKKRNLQKFILDEIMKPNMGTVDRIIRVLLAIIMAVLYFSGMVTGALGIILLVFAGIFLLTSLISFCPLYAPFKKD